MVEVISQSLMHKLSQYPACRKNSEYQHFIVVDPSHKRHHLLALLDMFTEASQDSRPVQTFSGTTHCHTESLSKSKCLTDLSSIGVTCG